MSEERAQIEAEEIGQTDAAIAHNERGARFEGIAKLLQTSGLLLCVALHLDGHHLTAITQHEVDLVVTLRAHSKPMSPSRLR